MELAITLTAKEILVFFSTIHFIGLAKALRDTQFITNKPQLKNKARYSQWEKEKKRTNKLWTQKQ